MEEYRQFYILEPFGAGRDNYHAAQIAHILATVHHNPKKGRPPKFADFIYEDPYTRAERKVEAADSFFFGSKGSGNGKSR